MHILKRDIYFFLVPIIKCVLLKILFRYLGLGAECFDNHIDLVSFMARYYGKRFFGYRFLGAK